MNFKSILPAVMMAAAATIPAHALRITEIMQSNVTGHYDDTGNFSDSWVELHNDGTTAINLAEYAVGIKKNADKAYLLPRTTLRAGDYVVVMCDKESTGLHTSFRLESDKEGKVILFHNGVGIDTVAHPAQPAPDIAFGLDPATGKWGYELAATPGAANAGGVCDAGQILPDPVFSHSGCVAPEFKSITISLPEGVPAGTEIRYTTDGSLPTAKSQQLADGGSIDVSSTTVVRARLFCQGWLSPFAVSHSYIRHHSAMSMPIVSLVTDYAYLSDSRKGILTDWNYEQDWRRPVNFEYFEQDGADAILNQLGEMRVGGGWSRSLPLKSLIVYANKRFGTKRLAHEFFLDQKPGLTDFKSIMLRNAGNDFYEAYMRDAVVQRTFCAHAGLDWQAHRPAAIYINGSFEGILNIRERSNDDNIYSNYNGLEDIDMIENWEELKAGTLDNFNQLMLFASQTGHTAAEFESIIDVREYLDVHLMNLYFNNTDFPGNNIVHWRPTATDGRWRLIVKDTDYAMGIGNASSDSKASPTFNTLEWLYTPYYPNANNWGNRSDRTRLFRRMMDCEEIREAFFDRALVYLGDALTWRNVEATIDRIEEEMAGEWPYHESLYGGSRWGSHSSCVGEMREWIERRSSIFTDMFAEYYNLGRITSLTVTADETADSLAVNGICLATGEFDGKYVTGRHVSMSVNPPANMEIEWDVTLTYDTGETSDQLIRGNELQMAIPACNAMAVNARVVDPWSTLTVPDAEADRGQWYDLQGRPVANPSRPGLYFRQGLKVVRN